MTVADAGVLAGHEQVAREHELAPTGQGVAIDDAHRDEGRLLDRVHGASDRDDVPLDSNGVIKECAQVVQVGASRQCLTPSADGA